MNLIIRTEQPGFIENGWVLTEVVYFAHTVDWSRNSFHTRLELQRQKLRVVTGLVQIATVKPQRRLTGWLPHIIAIRLPTDQDP